MKNSDVFYVLETDLGKGPVYVRAESREEHLNIWTDNIMDAKQFKTRDEAWSEQYATGLNCLKSVNITEHMWSE